MGWRGEHGAAAGTPRWVASGTKRSFDDYVAVRSAMTSPRISVFGPSAVCCGLV